MGSYNTLPRSEWPSTSFRAFFIYDIPKTVLTLHASAASVFEESLTYVVTCATPCSSADFAEHTVTHISGSYWAGQYEASGTVTSWGCDLGSGSDDILADQYGLCSTGTAAPGAKVTAGSVFPVNSCFVEARSALVYITAGMDKVYSYQPYYDAQVSPDDFAPLQQSELKELGCPATATTRPAESTTTAPSETGGSGKTTQAPNTSSTAAPTGDSGKMTEAPQTSSTSESGKPTDKSQSGTASASQTSGAIVSSSTKSLALLFGTTLLAGLACW